MRTIRVIALVLLTSLALACSKGGTDTEALQEKAITATHAGRQALKDYLAPSQKAPANTLTSWDRFLGANEEGIGRVRLAYARWKQALQAAVDGGVVDFDGVPAAKLTAYLEAAGQWVTDQEEQVRLARSCLTEAAGDFERFASCEAMVVRDHSSAWNANAAALNRLAGEIGYT